MKDVLTQAIEQFQQKKLNRREFVSVCMALGLGTGAISALLAACGGAPTATPAPAPTTAPAAASPAVAATSAVPTAAATTAAATPTAAAAASAGNTPKDKIIGALALDVDDLDPQYFKSIPGYLVAGNMYDMMMDYELTEDSNKNLLPVPDDVAGWKFKPSLADSWTLSDDRKVMTFKLNKNAKFKDGQPVTVDDWVYTLNRSLTGAGYTKLMMDLLTITTMDQVKAVDDSTLQITMTKPHPFPEMLFAINIMAPVEKTVLEQHKTDQDPTAHEWLKTNGVETGAYNLKSWKPGVGLEIEPNPNYWDAANVKNKGVILNLVPNPQDRLSMLQRGDIDLAYDLAPKDLATLKSDPNLKMIDFKIPWPFFMGLHNKLAPFDKKEVRQAIAYATPYQTIVDKVMYGFASECKSFLASGMPGSDFSLSPYKTDLTKAKQLLDSVGATNLEFEIGIQIGRVEDEQAATWIQANLQQIGVNMKINKMTSAQFYDLYNKGQLQAFMGEFYTWVNDPYFYVFWNFRSDSPINAVGYNNPDVDKLIADGMYEVDAASRMAKVKQLQQLILDDAPWIVLYQKNWTVAARSNVIDYPWYPDTVARFMHTYKG